MWWLSGGAGGMPASTKISVIMWEPEENEGGIGVQKKEEVIRRR